MRIALTVLGLDLLTLEVTTDADGDDPGDSMTSPVEVDFRLVEREGGQPRARAVTQTTDRTRRSAAP